MKFAMIGLGKMGLNLVKNAIDHEIEVVAYDVNQAAVNEAKRYSERVAGAASIDEMLDQLPTPKIVWVMVPAGAATNATIQLLAQKLHPGDILLDGGNSMYKDNLEQNRDLTE